MLLNVNKVSWRENPLKSSSTAGKLPESPLQKKSSLARCNGGRRWSHMTYETLPYAIQTQPSLVTALGESSGGGAHTMHCTSSYRNQVISERTDSKCHVRPGCCSGGYPDFPITNQWKNFDSPLFGGHSAGTFLKSVCEPGLKAIIFSWITSLFILKHSCLFTGVDLQANTLTGLVENYVFVIMTALFWHTLLVFYWNRVRPCHVRKPVM